MPYGDVDVDYYHYIIITTNVGKTIINQPWLGMATYHIYWWWWLGDGLWHIVLPTWSILILAQVTITLVCRSPYSTQEISTATMASMFSVPGLFGLSENTKAAANLVIYHVFFFFIKHMAKLLNLVQNLVKILDFQNSPQPFVRFFVIACVANLAEGWWLWAPVKKNGAAESHLTSIHPHFARSYCGRQNHIWIKVSRQNLRALG